MRFWPSEIYVYAAILLLALCSVMTRGAFMLFGDHIPLGEGVRRALRYAPAAALAAIVAPELLPWQPERGPMFDPKLIAGLVAILIFSRTRSAVLVIGGGMLVLWTVRWLLA